MCLLRSLVLYVSHSLCRYLFLSSLSFSNENICEVSDAHIPIHLAHSVCVYAWLCVSITERASFIWENTFMYEKDKSIVLWNCRWYAWYTVFSMSAMHCCASETERCGWKKFFSFVDKTKEELCANFLVHIHRTHTTLNTYSILFRFSLSIARSLCLSCYLARSLVNNRSGPSENQQ